VIEVALTRNAHQDLYDRLTDLAAFLAQLHRRSGTGHCVDPQVGLRYLDKLLCQLAAKGVIAPTQRGRLEALRNYWADVELLHTASEVLIHGDATPVNFVFERPGEVVAIDLERVRGGDGMTDLGCVAAELRHAFFLTTGDPAAGEPFIQHLYARYAAQLPVSTAEFGILTARGRFWMGVFELRIARNDWLDLAYRQRLVAEAERCLGH
jgi:Ser/Thr protein kinase RdoA (MazF antagonist)